ncbi:MAG: hypothetical protein ACW98F_12860, partial [Candidatus Hodarchaeales archaeon]
MAIKSNYRFKLLNIVPIPILALLLFNLLPNHVLISISAMNNGSDINLSPLSSSAPTVYVDRLLTQKDVYNSQSSDALSSELSFTNASNPNFAIGSQSGTGGGSITIRDSFNWTGIESLNTTNQYASDIPTNRTDSVTITNSTGFNRNEASFNITDVVAESDKRAIEEYGDPLLDFFTSRGTGGISNWHYEIAMSFTIQEEYANLTKVRTYTDGFGSATGNIYIVNSTSNAPDDTLLLSSQESLISSGLDPSWHEYTFDNPIILRSGITYFVVMNETNGDDVNDFWKWLYVQDGRDDGTVYYKYNSHAADQWTNQPGQDLPLEIEVLPVEYNGTAYVAKTYTAPTDVGFSYNTSVDDTALSAFEFDWNDTETHTFQTTTSVSFNLAFIANYTSSSNPLIGTTSYFVQNVTSSLWNVSFSTSAINTTYSVTNRTLVIQGLANDWDGSAIFHGSTLVYNSTTSGGLNGSIAYITNSDTMTINASKLSTAEFWNISFIASNYLLDLSLSQGGTSLDLPYQANVTDVLDLIFNVQTTGNTSYWIDFPNGSQVRKATDINNTHTSFSEEWDINASVDQTTNVNGTYNLQAFWINSAKTKVGTFTRQIAVFINTSLSVIAEGKVVIDQLFNVSTVYKSIHNSTDVKNAKIWCEANWTTNRFMTQNQTDYSYNASFSTVGQQAGDIGNLTIITQLYWFVNWTTTIFIKFIEDTNLSVNTSNVAIQWRENSTLRMYYNDTGGNPIVGATVTVDGTTAFSISNTYYFRLNTTDYAGVGSFPNLIINASHGNFVSREITFNLTITPGETSISGVGEGQNLDNITGGLSKAYANSSADSIEINLRYYHKLANDTLNTNAPDIASQIPYGVPVKESNLTWTILFYPNKTGNFLINLTFSLTNYGSTTFIFNLTVTKSTTAIFSEIGTSTTLYYNESMDFFLLYNNTDYDENITGLTEGAGITLNSTKISFLNRTGEYYWFQLSPTTLGLGFHAINITFYHAYFESSSLIVSLEVLSRPTSTTGQYDSQALINDTTIVNLYFANSSADSLIINLEYYDVLTTNTLNTGAPTIESLIPITNTLKEGNLSWTITFNPNQTGIFLINITFSLTNYTTALFIFHLTVNKAPSTIYNSLLSDPQVFYDENEDFFLLYNNSYYNENITGLTQGLGITLNNTKVSFLNRTGNYYWFRLSPTTLVLGLHTSNITFYHSYFESSSLIVNFTVITRPTGITGLYNSQSLTNDTTIVNRYFANSSADVIAINLGYYDVLTTNILNTGAPTIESLIPITNTLKEGNLSWTITFNPNQTGIFLININFSLTNYTNALFIFHLTVNKAETAIYNSLSVDPIVYYDVSMDFYLLYNNTNYNENITGLAEGMGITLNNTKVSFLNRTGEHYWFRLSPNTLPLGFHITNMTFTHAYFETSSIIISFEVLARLTSITGQYNSQPLINDTTIVSKYFANSSADAVVINLEYYDILTTNTLDTSAPTIETLIPII